MRRIKPLLFLVLTFAIHIDSQCQTDAAIETVLQKGHSRYVICLALSPDGRYLVTGSMDNTLILWNTKSGKEIRTFSRHIAPIRTVFFSPDGKSILSSSRDNKALVYDIYTGEVLVEIKLDKERLFKACYSPDGSKIFIMNDRTETSVWDAQSGEKLDVLKKSYNAIISPRWFTSDGSRVMSQVDNKELQLVDLKDSLNNKSFAIKKPGSYAISPDDKYLAVGGDKQIVKVFDLESTNEMYLLDPQEGKGWTGSIKMFMAFSSNGKYLITASKYYGLILWNARKGTRIKKFELGDVSLDEIAFSPDDKSIIATAGDESWIWNVKSGKEILHLSYKNLDCLPVFSPDGSSLLTAGLNNTAILWNISSGRKKKVYEGYLNKVRDDGLRFKESNWFDSNLIRYLSLKSNVSVTPDGKHLIKRNIDSTAIMLNIETGKIVHVFKAHTKVVLCTDISHDGKWLITGSGDRSIKLWDIESGQLIKTIGKHQALVFDIKFSSDSKYIVSSSWDGSMRIWETETSKQIKYIKFEKASPYSVNFTPNDLYIVSSDLENKLKLWEVDAGEEFRNIIGHTNIVADICFSADGKQMISAGHDAKVKVWDLLSGMLIAKFTGHSSGVFAVAAHSSGKYVASAGNDRTIKLWNPLTGKTLHTLSGHSGGISSLQFSKDGNTLISCTIDGEIKIWDLDTFKELYTYIQIDRDNWLAKNPQGYFDGSPNALKLINYVSGLESIAVGSLFEKYYTPNLVRRINSGEEFTSESSNLQELINKIPIVDIEVLPNNSLAEIVRVDSLEWFNKSISLAIQVTDQGGGVDELRLYNNGKLIQNIRYPGSGKRSGKKHEEIVEIPLFTGINNITALALDKGRSESAPISLQIKYDGVVSESKLFILSIGINRYENPSYQLNYAISDAKSYTRMIKKGAKGIFSEIEEFFIKDTDAQKENIQKVFGEIAQKAGPEDVFIFYFAGHGAVSMGNQDGNGSFYIIPYDVTNLYGDDEQLKAKAISTEEILELSKQITAQKQMFILDACQAGGALTAFNSRGANREKAIAQLARSTGTFFLLASGAVQYASEAKDLGHGIFTYAILEALEGKADGGSKDEKITASELKSYVEDRVPELTKEYMLTPQYPTGYSYGQDFPIVLVR